MQGNQVRVLDVHERLKKFDPNLAERFIGKYAAHKSD